MWTARLVSCTRVADQVTVTAEFTDDSSGEVVTRSFQASAPSTSWLVAQVSAVISQLDNAVAFQAAFTPGALAEQKPTAEELAKANFQTLALKVASVEQAIATGLIAKDDASYLAIKAERDAAFDKTFIGL